MNDPIEIIAGKLARSIHATRELRAVKKPGVMPLTQTMEGERIAELEAENAALRRDAEQYRLRLR